MISVSGRSLACYRRVLLSLAVGCALTVGARAVTQGDAVVSDPSTGPTTAGIIDATAGGNRSFLTGDGAGSGSAIDTPSLVAFAPNGTVYYVETVSSGLANSIISVSSAGTRAVVSGPTRGTGTAFVAISGLAWDPATSTLIVSDSGSSATDADILNVDPTTGNRAVITSSTAGGGAALSNPKFVTVADTGAIYYYESTATGTARGVVTVTLSGTRTLISGGSPTLGTGTGFVAVTGMAWDLSTETLIVADAGSSATTAGIVRVIPASGNRTFVTSNSVGGGVALDIPESVAVTLGGTIYYLEEDASGTANCVIAVNPSGGVRTIFSGGSVGTGTAFVAPTWVAAANLAPVITNATLTASGTVGVAFAPYLITGSNSPSTFSAVTLPAGLIVNSSTGAITGTPSAVGTFSVTIGVTNGAGTGTATLVITIGPPTLNVSPSTLPGTIVGATYLQTIAASGGTSPYAFVISAGTPVPGLTLSSGGVLSGTLTTAGSFNFTVKATDSSIGTGAPFSGTKNYTVIVAKAAATVTLNNLSQPFTGSPVPLTATSVPTVAGFIYSYTGTGATTYGPSATAPTNAGTYAVTATVNDPNYAGSATASLAITPITLVVNPATLAGGTVGTGYSQSITTSAGTAPYTFVITSGTPVPGLGLSSGGSLSGIPTAAGSFTFTVTATDSSVGVGAPFTGSQTYIIGVAKGIATVTLASASHVYTGAPIALTASSVPAVAGFVYSYTGTGATAYGPSAAAPTNVGTYSVTATVNDPNRVGSAAASLTITPATAAVTLASATRAFTGSPIALTATSVPVVAGFTYSYTGTGATGYGPSPAAPTGIGTYTVTATVNDPNYAGSATASLTISAAAISVSPATLPNATVGAAYPQTFTALGGTAPYTFAVTSGTPIPGLILSSGGALSGTPTTAGSFTFAVTATDSSAGPGAPFTGSQTYTVVVAPGSATVTLASASLPYTGSPIPLIATSTPTVAGFTYSYTGTGATTYGPSATAPTNTGSYAVTATVNDPNYVGSAAATLTITPASQTITFTPIGTVTQGVAYTLAATASSGLPVTFTVQSGTATITGNSLKITVLTPVTIAANQAGNANYSAATTVTQTVTAARASTRSTLQNPNDPGTAADAAAAVITPSAQIVGVGASPTLSVSGAGAPQWEFNGVLIPGATGATLTLPNIGTNQAGTYSVVVLNADGTASTGSATVGVTADASLVDVSARADVGATDAQALYAGFMIAGAQPEQLLIRGIGPSLAQFQVGGVLASPELGLFDATGTVIATDVGSGSDLSLGSSPVAAIIQPVTASLSSRLNVFALPAISADSGMLASLPPGLYTAKISGLNQTTGAALAELTATGPAGSSGRLSNLSARAQVGTGANVLVAGIVISGTTSETLLIRGVGPSLSAFGLTGALAAPQLTLYDSSGNVIAINVGWASPVLPGNSGVAAGLQSATAAVMTSVNAFALPAGSSDSALVVTLPPGAYTAELSGVGGTAGTGLIEVYDVPASP